MGPGGAGRGAIGLDDEVFVFLAEEGNHRRIAVRLERCHQRIDRRLRRGKGVLRGRAKRERDRQHQRQHEAGNE
jgi:IS30 family transposase